MISPNKRYTVSEFEDYIASYPDSVFELIEGKIVEKMTSEEHGKIVINIGSELRFWQKQNNIKGHYSTQASHRLAEDDYNERRPDVSFRNTDDAIS